jgi:uncharacterized membrane protein YeaQ/YmgE (transglycosylase-associated protein family)
MTMSFLGWIVMGLIVGGVTGFIMKSSYRWYIDILLGVVGSAVGGWLSSVILGVDLTGRFNLPSIIWSILGAVVVVSIVRIFTRTRYS